MLGAGFSVDAALPTIADFLNRMRDAADWVAQEHRDSERAAVERVLEFRHTAAAAGYRIKIDLDNIEDLFSLAAAAPEEDVSNAVQLAIGATLNFCQRHNPPRQARMRVSDARGWKISALCRSAAERITETGGDSVDVHSSVYDLYAASIGGQVSETADQNTVITFNYDLLLEEAAARMGLPFSYGLREQSVVYEDEGQSTPKPTGDGLVILKLHGSLNWARRPDGTLGVYKTYDAAVDACRFPHLIPPTWDKAISDATRTVWRHAIEALSEATRIVIIGLSFRETDAHLKYLLAAGLMNNSALRTVVIVNPSATKLGGPTRSVFRSDQIDYGIVRFVDKEVGEYFLDVDELKAIGRSMRHTGLDLLEIGSTRVLRGQ